MHKHSNRIVAVMSHKLPRSASIFPAHAVIDNCEKFKSLGLTITNGDFADIMAVATSAGATNLGPSRAAMITDFP
jgi:hypothetical protein